MNLYRIRLKNLFLLVLVVALIVNVAAIFGCSKKSLPIVCITQIASHPSLDEVRRGIVESLADKGYRDKDTIELIFRNANGDPSLTLPIAQDFVRKGAAVIVPISTPSALAAAKSTDRIPIVFGGVTNPLGVGLIKNLENPEGNITGTSDRWPYEKQLELFRKLLPEVKIVGMLYTAGDDVASAAIEEIKKHASKLGLSIEIRPVSNASDIYPSAVAMFRNVDAIYAGMDNLIAENLESILKAANEAGKPVLAGDAQSVERGALATWSISMYDLGQETGDMVALILQGRKPSQLPVRLVSGGKPVVNKAAAETFKLKPNLLDQLGVQLVGSGADKR